MSKGNNMNWLKLESIEQLATIKEKSKENAVLIFKHSTGCSVSCAALGRLERNWKQEEMNEVKTFYLDLLKHRALSNQIALEFRIEHESPQILLIENGLAVYDRSHLDINYADLANHKRNNISKS